MEMKSYEDDQSFGSAARTAAEIKAGFYAIVSIEEFNPYGENSQFFVHRKKSKNDEKARSKASRQKITNYDF